MQRSSKRKEPQETERNPSGCEQVATESSMWSAGPGRMAFFKKLVAQPLADLVHDACDFQIEQTTQFAGPGDEYYKLGTYHSPLFWFTWILTGHAELKDRTAKEAWEKVEVILRASEDGQLVFDPWVHWFDMPRDDAQAEFMAVWATVRYAPGRSPLENALARAKQAQLDLRPEICQKRPDSYPAFVSLAGWLQVVVGDRNILLPCRSVAEQLGVAPITVSRYRRAAIEDGYLRPVREHRFRSQGHGDATEFRFDVTRFPALSQQAAGGTAESFRESVVIERKHDVSADLVRLRRHFEGGWRRHHGCTYYWQPKDSEAAKVVLEAAQGRMDRAEAIVDAFLDDQDTYVVERGHELSLLPTRVNAYLARLGRDQPKAELPF